MARVCGTFGATQNFLLTFKQGFSSKWSGRGQPLSGQPPAPRPSPLFRAPRPSPLASRRGIHFPRLFPLVSQRERKVSVQEYTQGLWPWIFIPVCNPSVNRCKRDSDVGTAPRAGAGIFREGHRIPLLLARAEAAVLNVPGPAPVLRRFPALSGGTALHPIEPELRTALPIGRAQRRPAVMAALVSTQVACYFGI